MWVWGWLFVRHPVCIDTVQCTGAMVNFCLGIYIPHYNCAHCWQYQTNNNRGNFGPRRLQYNIREFVNSGSSDNATNVVSAVKRMRLTQVGLGCQVPGTQGQPGCEGLCGGEVAQLEAPRWNGRYRMRFSILIKKYLSYCNLYDNYGVLFPEKIVIQIK